MRIALLFSVVVIVAGCSRAAVAPAPAVEVYKLSATTDNRALGGSANGETFAFESAIAWVGVNGVDEVHFYREKVGCDVDRTKTSAAFTLWELDRATERRARMQPAQSAYRGSSGDIWGIGETWVRLDRIDGKAVSGFAIARDGTGKIEGPFEARVCPSSTR